MKLYGAMNPVILGMALSHLDKNDPLTQPFLLIVIVANFLMVVWMIYMSWKNK